MNFDIICKKIDEMHDNNKKIELYSYFELLDDKDVIKCLDKAFG